MADLNLQNPGDWLFDTSYWCMCKLCKQRYFGPKRSPACWECSTEHEKEQWVNYNQDKIPKTPVIITPSGQ